MSTAIRAVLVLIGLASIIYGVSLMWQFPTAEQLSIVVWLALGLAAHDAVLAPIALGVAWLIRRSTPTRWWVPLMTSLANTNVLLLLAVPVVLPRLIGSAPANPTVADRNYWIGLTVAIAVVWVLIFAVFRGSAWAARLPWSHGRRQVDP
ncbi:hypothetical protein [Gordonia soli]|uniref:Uncharacterized protein n=1 Tax=Gordonia soli NBRC 108243 TaxID=1223545 RepID=M0QGN0_9ACTN|nr:hypothetical protein [Gordonia soli]GAC66567.1 hypothetical protein GS4_03_00140 [Gordonia soli NBRC 108243]